MSDDVPNRIWPIIYGVMAWSLCFDLWATDQPISQKILTVSVIFLLGDEAVRRVEARRRVTGVSFFSKAPGSS